MRNARAFAVSLPPEMMAQHERTQKAEQRPRATSVRAVVRPHPLGEAHSGETRAIERGRREIERGDYVTLDQLKRELDCPPLKVGRKDHRTRARA